MRSLGFILLILGVGSCIVHFMEREMTLLAWIDTWGEEVAWAIRAGFIVLGLVLIAMGKKKSDKK